MNKGYIVISTVLVVLVVVTIIGISVSLLSISEIQQSLAQKKSQQSLNLVESCVNDALILLNKDGALPNSVTFPDGSCSVQLNSQVGDSYNFTVSNQNQKFYKSITVQASRNLGVIINSWQE